MTAPALPEIDMAAAIHVEHALVALADKNIPRAIGHLASIDAVSWAALAARFPVLPHLVERTLSHDR